MVLYYHFGWELFTGIIPIVGEWPSARPRGSHHRRPGLHRPGPIGPHGCVLLPRGSCGRRRRGHRYVRRFVRCEWLPCSYLILLGWNFSLGFELSQVAVLGFAEVGVDDELAFQVLIEGCIREDGGDEADELGVGLGGLDVFHGLILSFSVGTFHGSVVRLDDVVDHDLFTAVQGEPLAEFSSSCPAVEGRDDGVPVPDGHLLEVGPNSPVNDKVFFHGLILPFRVRTFHQEFLPLDLDVDLVLQGLKLLANLFLSGSRCLDKIDFGHRDGQSLVDVFKLVDVQVHGPTLPHAPFRLHG